MLTRRGLFKRLGQAALGLAVVPLLSRVGSASADINRGWVLRPGFRKLTLKEIVTIALHNRSSQLADNVLANNALLTRLRERQVFHTLSSGIEERL